MKAVPLILVIFLFNISGSLGQDNSDISRKRNFFYFYPTEIISSNFQLGYEWDFGKKNSLMLVAGAILNKSGGAEKQGFTGEIHLRMPLYAIENNENFLLKLYWSPFVKYDYIEYYYSYETCIWDNNFIQSCEQPPDTYTKSFGAGVVSGARMILAKKIVFNLFVGGGLRYSDNTYDATGINLIDVLSRDPTIFLYKPGYSGTFLLSGCPFGLAF